MKSSFLLLVACLAAPLARGQFSNENVLNLPPADDVSVVFPESFDTDTKAMQENWYLQRYAVLDSMSHLPINAQTPDDVYIERLQRLPTVMEMAYNPHVKRFIEMYAYSRPQLVEKMLGMSLYYMPIFEEALERYGCPLELKYLPVIESALDPNAKSRAGAVGLWQFMLTTATGEGLEVNSLVDQRRDPIASSDAAARYLKKLYDIYGDWNLAIAGYNCGPGNVNKAIKRAGDGKKTFWEIWKYLPEETRSYVPAFIAANYIMNYYGAHGISPALARKPIVTDTIHVNHRVHFQQIADVLGIPVEGIRMLNPQYREDIIPGNIKPYPLILPSVQAYCYIANEDSILAHNSQIYAQAGVVDPNNLTKTAQDAKGTYTEDITYITHKVKRGETLKSISKAYGVTAEEIRQANSLHSTKVRRGQSLRIPQVKRVYVDTPEIPVEVATTDSATVDTPVVVEQVEQPQQPAVKDQPKKDSRAKQQRGAQYTTYTVRSGDSLSRIAAKHHTTVAKIRSANNLRSDMIHPGQKLKIPK